MYTDKELKFGDLLELLNKHPDLVVFVGVNDLISNKAMKDVFIFFSNKKQKVIYLNYDQNKSLMLDLNIKIVPIVIIFKDMNIDEYITLPNIRGKLETYYENLKTVS